jgi:hypothetical protein
MSHQTVAELNEWEDDDNDSPLWGESEDEELEKMWEMRIHMEDEYHKLQNYYRGDDDCEN